MEFVTAGVCIGIAENMDQWEVLTKYRDGEQEMKPGNFVVMNTNGAITNMLLCCPACGECSFSGRGNTGKRKIYQEGDNTYTSKPSLIFQCCGWHGHLTKNVFHL